MKVLIWAIIGVSCLVASVNGLCDVSGCAGATSCDEGGLGENCLCPLGLYGSGCGSGTAAPSGGCGGGSCSSAAEVCTDHSGPTCTPCGSGCLNGGTCYVIAGASATVECLCAEGFSGTDCSTGGDGGGGDGRGGGGGGGGGGAAGVTASLTTLCLATIASTWY